MTSRDPLCEAVRNTCVLATIRTRALGTTRTDKVASREVTQAKGATNDAARVVVSRLPGADDLHKKIVSAQNQLKQVLFELSMPYPDEGWRLLPNANFQKFLERGSPINNTFKGFLAELQSAAPGIIALAKQNAGSLNVPLPTEDELVNAYEMYSDFREVPEGNFRGMPEATAGKLQRMIESRLSTAVSEAVDDTLGRFMDPLERFIERMTAFDQREAAIAAGQDVGRNGVFRDTVVLNIRELVQGVGALNVVGDGRLYTLQEHLKLFEQLEPDTLRGNANERTAARQKVEQVLGDLREWMSP